jgi:hypothetical protein
MNESQYSEYLEIENQKYINILCFTRFIYKMSDIEFIKWYKDNKDLIKDYQYDINDKNIKKIRKKVIEQNSMTY